VDRRRLVSRATALGAFYRPRSQLILKPYVDLALMSGNKGEEPESYWSRMRAAFLSGSASSARDGASVPMPPTSPAADA